MSNFTVIMIIAAVHAATFTPWWAGALLGALIALLICIVSDLLGYVVKRLNRP